MYADLVDLIGRIADYVFEKEEEVRKGVGEVMGGKILKLRSEILWESGRKSGLEEGHKFGLEEGRKFGLVEGHKSGLEEGRKFGLVEGHKSGLEEGRKFGLVEGRKSGLEESLRIFIEDKIEDGCSEETIISKLVRHYHFSPEEAKARYRSCSLQSV